MKKIVTVIGARPQFVKAAVLSRIIKEYNSIEEVIIHTGQHFDANMSKIFFEEMMIPEPTYNLEINNMSHAAMTGQMMEKIEKVLQVEQPDALIVYGDTNSTIAGALAAKKMNIKVVHIEAGLRSFNMKMPEEINRILTDRISDLLSCPTEIATDNLKKEGFDNLPILIEKHGDIMKDAVGYYSQFSEKISSIISEEKLQKMLNFCLKYIANLDIPVKRGTFIEYRTGLINVSPIGRNCSQKERNEFAILEPFIPIIQSASLREYAASLNALYSSPDFLVSHAF